MVWSVNLQRRWLISLFALPLCADQRLIALTEQRGYGVALVNVGGGRQQLMSDCRNNDRCMIDDEQTAAIIFQRIAPFLPTEVRPRGVGGVRPCTVVGVNERLRFLKYTKGQQFKEHYDGSFTRDSPKPGFERPEVSLLTVQLYLNDGEAEGGAAAAASADVRSEFSGGSTAFLNPKQYSQVVDCHPRAGRVLIFQHQLLHRGSEVTRGQKYCMRSDIMYQPSNHIELTNK